MNPAKIWHTKARKLTFDAGPAIMGIVNVTPDSFSDGGKFFDPQAAIDHALKLAEQGAAILDVGGESTRPYSHPVPADEEKRRVLPVIAGIVRQTQTPVSVDTSKASIAKAALDAGAEIINDVTGLEGDPEMARVAAESGAGVCAMHMQGTPQTMQDRPTYDNVVEEIYGYLLRRKDDLLQKGIASDKICLDPGIGFGKTHEHNVLLINHAQRFLELDSPILVGHSRKGFLGKLLGDSDLQRDLATLTATILLAQKGIQIIRVHEVEKTCQAMKVLFGITRQQEKS
jgi:dihydropteroate synthase